MNNRYFYQTDISKDLPVLNKRISVIQREIAKNSLFQDVFSNNNFSYPSPEDIRSYQRRRLKDASDSAMEKIQKNLNPLNNFFTTSGKFLDPNVYSGVEVTAQEKYLAHLGESLFKDLDSLFDFKIKKSPMYKAPGEVQKIDNMYLQMIKMLNTASSGQPVNVHQMQSVVSLFGQSSLADVIKHSWHYKGLALEELGTAKLNSLLAPLNEIAKKNNTPQYIAINLGDKLDSSGKKEITDIGIFNLADIEQNFNKSDNTISLESLDVSKMLVGIQAKSGQRQIPWNINTKRASVSLSQTNLNNHFLSNKYYRELEAMYKIEELEKNPVFQKYSFIYNAIGNYLLGNVVNTFLHLDQNQVLLTRRGFQSYYERIVEDLAKSSGPIFNFKKSLTLRNKAFFTELRAITLNRK